MRIGVIGAGQLGRMLALAGYPLGLRFVFLDQSADAPGAQVGRIVRGAFDDPAALRELAEHVDVVTFDVENVPVEAVQPIAALKPFLPPVEALGASQDRLYEKTLFRELGVPTPPFQPVDSLDDLQAAVRGIGLPGVLKTRRMGYDGRGQCFLRSPQDVTPAWEKLGATPLIYEGFVDFSREVSIIAVRSTTGETRFYPLCANTHESGILRYSTAPYRHASLQKQAETYARRLLQRFDYAGVLTIEFFVRRGTLIANEMAPRVHNSGHWTIEGSETSQFQNHLRAVLGMPLGDTRMVGYACMLNWLGEMPDPEPVLREAGGHWHDYGKASREGRKVGHATLRADSRQELAEALRRVGDALDRRSQVVPVIERLG